MWFFAGEGNVVLPALTPGYQQLLWLVLGSAVLSLLYGWFVAAGVMKKNPGSEKMQAVAAAVEEGALTYLKRQFNTMLIFVILLAVGLWLMFKNSPEYAARPDLAIGVAVAFFLGVMASYIAGYVGMRVAVKANTRVAHAALTSFKGALEIAFQGGTVSGMFTIGMGLLGATIIFMIYKQDAMKVLVGFGFGGSLAALFMRMGGGIFTKAADVGADLVGKVEAGIPEDDPRNAATIADNVGDNVGDCAGMAADVFESYEVTLVAAIILGAAVSANADIIKWLGSNEAASNLGLALVVFPMLVRAVGVFASAIGTWCVKGSEGMKDPMVPITTGFYVSAAVSLAGCAAVNYYFLKNPDGQPDFRYFWATASGVILGIVILALTDFYTHIDKPAVTETAYSTKTGVATLILSGLAQGLQSSVWSVVAICGAIFASLSLFQGQPALQMYGIALSGLGLLTTTGYVLAMDTYGPVTDNANGIFEMSGALKEGAGNERAHQIVAKLDAIGNTTKALTKGLAIATAVLAAMALFSSFVTDANLLETGIQVNLPDVFIGLLLGGAVPFLFSGFAINAVSRTAFLIVEEVRRQFREIKGIWDGSAKPDYSRCVDICTAGAQKELLGPALLGICSPIIVGFWLGAAALGAFLAGAIMSGQLMAVFMSNTGGIWDNAKKKIEEGLFGGKGSEAHKAGVVGDTVGDPLKDTAGPALNPLIKVMNLVSLLIIPFVLAKDEWPPVVKYVVLGVAVLAVAFAVYFANRESVVDYIKADELKQAAKGPGGRNGDSSPVQPAGKVPEQPTVV